MKRTLLLVLVFAAACGGRSSLLPPWAKSDGASRRDAGDAGPSDGRLFGDRTLRLDRFRPDSCLPIPAKEVQGKYSGYWVGTWKCPGQDSVKVGGDLAFILTPAGSPEAFTVVGTMKGNVEPGYPFSTKITGTMGCTSLSGQLPEIVVGSGRLIYTLKGSLVGTFDPFKKFFEGSWKANEKGGSCAASGGWYGGPGS